MNIQEAQPAQTELKPAEVRSIIIGVLLAMFLAALDQTIVATAMPTIGRELGDLEHLPWVVSAYLLAATAVTPLYGKASDIYGRRSTLLVGISVFVIGSIACALAPNLVSLIIARAVQGLGGGGLLSLGQTIIADIVTPRERPRYQVYIVGVFMVSSLAGPLLGGVFAQYLHWSMIFWINLPLGIAAFWMTYALLKKLPRHERPHKLDILGSVLMVAATVTLMLALSWAGVHYAWRSLEIFGLVATSAMLWMLFLIRLRTAHEPLIPSAIFKNGVVFSGIAAAFFAMGTFIGLAIYVPLYLEALYQLSASRSGFALIPFMVGTITGAAISARVMVRVINYKRMPIIGMAMATLGLAFLAFQSTPLPLPFLLCVFTVISLGLGSILPVTTISIQNAVEPYQMGIATATMNFFRQLGGAIIVAMFGAIVLSGVPDDKMPNLTQELLYTLMRAGGFNSVFQGIFGISAMCLALSLLFLILMEQKPLRSGAVKASD
jgi:EmrB/QacA subfamily drug resistance transporter